MSRSFTPEQLQRLYEVSRAIHATLESEEAQLYTTPAHLIGVVPAGMGASDETEDSANRWLAGIMEVPLSTEEKIAAIEQTEKAKRAMMDKQRAKQEMREKEQEREHHTLVMPGNYNSNFHQHRRENAIDSLASSALTSATERFRAESNVFSCKSPNNRTWPA